MGVVVYFSLLWLKWVLQPTNLSKLCFSPAHCSQCPLGGFCSMNKARHMNASFSLHLLRHSTMSHNLKTATLIVKALYEITLRFNVPCYLNLNMHLACFSHE